ncbi:MAG: hypothetical protein RLZZ401_1282 [Pseudomonadota bacterium]
MNAKLMICLRLLSALACLGAAASLAQSTGVLRATELRADKLPSADVLGKLEAGTALTLLGVEGGWAHVQAPGAARLTGWVRASSINLQVGQAAAASMVNGRLAANSNVLSLGVRKLRAHDSRHALIIGISRYADARVPTLPGAQVDSETATQMARAMQVPEGNIRYLQDSEATGDGIRRALADLNARVEEGDRVFVHYSGHGTRYTDAQAGGCVEALLAYDGGAAGTVTNRELAALLKPLTQKADKLFVMYDACYSGGVAQLAPTARERGLANQNDEGRLRPKFALTSEECSRPTNVRSLSLVDASAAQGTQPQDIVHVSASRDSEISFDDEHKGGLATQFMRDCMLRDALDLDGSGAITIDEIRQCAQVKLNKRMKNDPLYKPQNITVNGNAGFVPAWFSQDLPAAAEAVPAAANAPAPVALTGEQALRQLLDQRDAKRSVQVTLAQPSLRIGQDALSLAVRSDRAGYLYIAQAGSDNQALYLLFPNDLDSNNRIAAGQTVTLPRPSWRVKAGGPAGTDSLLVMVTDAPRDVQSLKAAKAGPFLASLNDAQGRARLGELMGNANVSVNGQCGGATGPGRVPCSDAYGAVMVTVEERN